MAKILTAQNIIKTYRSARNVNLEVLKSVSIEIEENKISVIVGASGAGKSTLLHILSGLDRADSGSVMYGEQNIFTLSDDKLAKFRNRNIGFVFQFHHLLPEFTAAENVAIPLMINKINYNEAYKKALELIEMVGLSDRADHKPAELSGGEQQRIAVARALANNPSIIFADEPTGNLDSANSESLHKIFINLRDNLKKTFVIVTHNASLMQLANTVYEMKDGIIHSITDAEENNNKE